MGRRKVHRPTAVTMKNAISTLEAISHEVKKISLEIINDKNCVDHSERKKRLNLLLSIQSEAIKLIDKDNQITYTLARVELLAIQKRNETLTTKLRERLSDQVQKHVEVNISLEDEVIPLYKAEDIDTKIAEGNNKVKDQEAEIKRLRSTKKGESARGKHGRKTK